jgi:dGTPase
MVDDLLTASLIDSGRIKLAFSPALETNLLELRAFLYRHVYKHQLLSASLSRADLVIEELYRIFTADRGLLLEYYPIAAQVDGPPAQAVCDFVSGMTDRYAQALHQRLFQKAQD